MVRPPAKAVRTIETLLAAYPTDVQALASAARRSLRTWLPNSEEVADPVAPVIGYGYGPGYKGLVCTLLVSKTGVKIGLARGAELADPHGLLGGSGKVHRYVQLRNAADLRNPDVRALVKATYAAWKQRM
jgi:hypothetical protein